MNDEPSWPAVAVGAGLILIPEPATTATGVALVGAQFLPEGERPN